MDNKIITAAGVNINVDKHEDEKTKERRLMAYAFKMVRAESGLSLIHISEPTRRTPISYAVFCLKKKKK